MVGPAAFLERTLSLWPRFPMACVPRQLCAGAAQLAACEAADADADSDADSDGDDSTLYACTLASAARSRLRFRSLCTCVVRARPCPACMQADARGRA